MNDPQSSSFEAPCCAVGAVEKDSGSVILVEDEALLLVLCGVIAEGVAQALASVGMSKEAKLDEFPGAGKGADDPKSKRSPIPLLPLCAAFPFGGFLPSKPKVCGDN